VFKRPLRGRNGEQMVFIRIQKTNGRKKSGANGLYKDSKDHWEEEMESKWSL